MIDRAEPEIERPDLAQMAAELAGLRAQAELDLLAAIAPIPREACVVLAGKGVSAESFCNLDTIAIYLALMWAGDPFDPPRSMPEVARMARTLLRSIENGWDDTDERSYVTGCMTWGPGPLAALLYAMGAAEAELMLVPYAEWLLELKLREERLIAPGGGA
jgi:hypothetical protein